MHLQKNGKGGGVYTGEKIPPFPVDTISEKKKTKRAYPYSKIGPVF